MARVDADDDSLDRWVVQVYRYDPERRERRHVTVAAFDTEREMARVLRVLSRDIERRRAAGEDVPASEHASGHHRAAGHRRRAAEGRQALRAMRHGVAPAPSGDVPGALGALEPVARRVALSHVAGRVGDHNDLAMVGSSELAAGLAGRLGTPAHAVGRPEPALSVGWAEELAAARPLLTQVADRLDAVLADGRVPVTAIGRCASALATLPVLARHRPDAVVVWFDAHADLNTPDDSDTGYLGGMALSGPLGLWDSGLGAGLAADRAVLVGARDLDPPERDRVAQGAVTFVGVGPDMAEELGRVVAGRPVYVHVDCDVLDAGTVPTDYRVPGGPSLSDLRDCLSVLARSEVVGVEVGELESAPDEADPPSYVTVLLDVLEPLLATVTR